MYVDMYVHRQFKTRVILYVHMHVIDIDTYVHICIHTYVYICICIFQMYRQYKHLGLIITHTYVVRMYR